MSYNRKEALDAIMQAMEIEKETFDYYTGMAQKTFHPGGKRIFKWLANTEEVHYLKLTELYNSLNQGGQWVYYGGSTITLESGSPAENNTTFDTSDREALEIAIEIEKKGIAFFLELINKTTDPAGREMLNTLLNEEKEHLRVITEKREAMKGCVEAEPSRSTVPQRTATEPEGKQSIRTRTEKDSLGAVEVPAEAYYGAQTVRALENFPISGLKPHPELVWATLVIKKSAAIANMGTGRLDDKIGRAIVAAADEALAGGFADQFVVDPFQAGAGTSHNMNINEVLASRAAELLGGSRGETGLVHPNDHVNMAQSTNDVFPTAMRLASLRILKELFPRMRSLQEALRAKGVEFDHVLKSGRTHLQDAVPIRLGQEFDAYSEAIAKNLAGIERTLPDLQQLGIGGTAVGTGLNAEPRYIDLVVEEIARETGFPVCRAANLIETTQNMDPFVALSSALKGLAVNLIRISNDLRLLSSGPRTGFAEINLPPVQPGSSIMPGKVNPVMAEVTDMVAFQVIGADTVVTLAAQAGQMELNVMMPVIALNLIFSLEILKNVIHKLTTACIEGITVNEARCLRNMEKSVGLFTVLAPLLGYAETAEVAKESLQTGENIREIILARKLLPPEVLAEILEPYTMTNPGVPVEKLVMED
jgi:aspartate ammonia-lyase